MSPRRSSRARMTQSTPSGTKLSNSSSSSINSGRASQSAGPDPKSASRSQSSEEIDAAQARRSKRSQNAVKDEAALAIDDDVEDEGEEEVTRCICGNQEYPGLPLSGGDSSRGSSKTDPDPAALAEDTTGWFIQCDDCKVWQHGGCVGIMDESTSPEEYFCEQCRKDLHRVTTSANGRKYSSYIPMKESKSPQSSPVSAPKKHSKKTKNGKAAQVNADNMLKGRRSTMNSRDAVYAEEQLRRVLEESKREGQSAGTATATRKGKRSRSDSEERTEDSKRQRTISGSASSASQSKSRRRDSNVEEEAEKPERLKNIRGAAARNHRNKEARDREAQREKERADAGRRKVRIERDDESRSATPEAQGRTSSARGSKTATTSFPNPPLPDQPPPKPSHKKTGRPPTRKGRIGRNQYTKDRDPPPQNDTNHKSSPAPSNSSENADGGTPHVNGYTNGDNNGVGKPSKPRHMNPSRTTMNDMKRRVAGILEFISHTQVDIAGSTTALTTKSSTSTNTPPNSNGTSKSGELSEGAVNAALMDLDAIDEQAFSGLSSLEMMEVLTRRLMKWQGEYGKWGDK